MVFPRRLPAASATVIAASEKSPEISWSCDDEGALCGRREKACLLEVRGEKATAPPIRREKMKVVNRISNDSGSQSSKSEKSVRMLLSEGKSP